MAYKTKEQQQAWVDANQDKIKEYKRNWYLKNKQSKKRLQGVKEARNKFLSSYVDGYHRVYLLEDYNYVGVTNDIYTRFANHKSKFGRDCTNYKILFKSKNRDKALEIETEYHNMGYEGKHHKNLYK